ncbi:MAG: protein kinase [Acidobacteria bacterium]|nr:protein kinase [Acidobacteriota bacterium]
MGEVYLAQDTRLGRKVAIKLLPSQFSQDKERLRRFEQEAFAASALNHPNIITIYEVGQANTEAGNCLFIVTEFIEGQTLRRKMAGGKIPVNDVLEIASQIASALSAAHNAGIIHRDLKPENLMIRPDGYVKMLDFGLAKLTESFSPDLTGGMFDTRIDSSEFRNYPEYATSVGDTTSMSASAEEQHTAEPPATSLKQTVPGVVMGTAQYMSPEQARGQRVDWRTDLFSFGIVLYEMLAGRAPFVGTSPKEIVAAILHNEPMPLSNYLPEIPESLEWIISKALVKDREERYQTAREMLNDFKRLQRRLDVERELSRSFIAPVEEIPGTTTEKNRIRPDSDKFSGNTTQELNLATGVIKQSSGLFAHLSGKGPKNRFVNPLFIALALTTLLAVTFSIYTYLSSRKTVRTPFQTMQVRRFTATGKASRAAISPDGKYVVHVLIDAGKQSLLIRQVTDSNNVEIVPPSDLLYRGLTFSRNGTSVYFVAQERTDPIQSLYQVPVLGGTPKKVLRDIDSPVAISPDGKQLAFIRRLRGKGEDQLMLANADGSNIRTLSSRKGADFYNIAGLDWSPDGKLIACPAGSNSGVRHMFVAEINVATGQEKPLSPTKWANVGRVSWVHDGKGLVIGAMEQGSSLTQIWFVPYPGGQIQRITNDLNDYRDMLLTDDSRSLVAVQTEAQVNVWLTAISDPQHSRQLTEGIGQRSGERGLTWMPNGNLVYISRASGSADIWLMDQEGKSQQQLTTAETRAEIYPEVTLDGRYIVFVSTRTGNSHLYRLDLSTGDQVQLTFGVSEEFPAISADGKWVIYNSTASSKFTLWRVSIDGGPPVQLNDQLTQWPTVSTDGQRIACWYRAEPSAPWKVALIPITGGQPETIIDLPNADMAFPVRWTPDGKGISFVSTRNGISNIWLHFFEGGEPKQLTQFTSDQIFWFDWSRDGKQLATSRGRVANDVVLISDLK